MTIRFDNYSSTNHYIDFKEEEEIKIAIEEKTEQSDEIPNQINEMTNLLNQETKVISFEKAFVDDVCSRIALFVSDYRLAHVNRRFNLANRIAKDENHRKIPVLILSRTIQDPELAQYLNRQNLNGLLETKKLFKLRADLRKILEWMNPIESKKISENLDSIDIEIKKLIYVFTTSKPIYDPTDHSRFRDPLSNLVCCLAAVISLILFSRNNITNNDKIRISGITISCAILGIACLYLLRDAIRYFQSPYLQIRRIEYKYNLLDRSCKILQNRAANIGVSLNYPTITSDDFNDEWHQWFTQIQQKYPSISFNRV